MTLATGETVTLRATVPPQGGQILMIANHYLNQVSQRGDVWQFPIQGGSGTIRWSRTGQTVHWLGDIALLLLGALRGPGGSKAIRRRWRVDLGRSTAQANCRAT